jgi:peptidase C13-like protein
MLPRLALCLCACAFLLLGGLPAAAAPGPGAWQAVLVAGDDAQPVFDNAVATVTRWLEEHGEPAADIHRLSASRAAGGQAIEPATIKRVLRDIASLQPRPGERCLVFITSHGQRGEGVYIAADHDFLRPDELARALSEGCARVPTVVIVSSCYSGVFAAPPMRAANRIILTAARGDRPSFGCQADRTYTVFDECLLGTLARAATWRAVYQINSACVRQREKWLGVLPSQPQASFGAAVTNLPVP